MTHLKCLWRHWMLGMMSEWIKPCNTWHQLFYSPELGCTVVGTKRCPLPVTRDGTWWWVETCRLPKASELSVSAELRETLSLWNFTAVTVWTVCRIMPFDGPISQKWTEFFPRLKMFFFFFCTLQWSLGKSSTSQYYISLSKITQNFGFWICISCHFMFVSSTIY